MTATPFFVVWAPSRSVPTKQHGSLSQAETEAQRLARAHPAEPFFVLAAVARVEKIDVAVTRFTIDPDSPADEWPFDDHPF